MNHPSFAWRGPRGSGKRTQLIKFLERQSLLYDIPFEIQYNTWYLNKSSTQKDESTDDNEPISEGDLGKSIPFEESHIHLGFDVARMSMSDKVFIQSILARWTGQQDIFLTQTDISMRYLVLYHAQYLTDESIIQIQEILEQYSYFAILMTTELPLPIRLKDYCLEIPVPGNDMLLAKYISISATPEYTNDVWLEFFKKTLNEWSAEWSPSQIPKIRQWCYICLQRNLHWSDVIMYWIESIYTTTWLSDRDRKKILDILWRVESGSGWTLITSYRIPIHWEHVHLELARAFYEIRQNDK